MRRMARASEQDSETATMTVQPRPLLFTLACPRCNSATDTANRYLFFQAKWKQVLCTRCRSVTTANQWKCPCGIRWPLCQAHRELGFSCSNKKRPGCRINGSEIKRSRIAYSNSKLKRVRMQLGCEGVSFSASSQSSRLSNIIVLPVVPVLVLDVITVIAKTEFLDPMMRANCLTELVGLTLIWEQFCKNRRAGF